MLLWFISLIHGQLYTPCAYNKYSPPWRSTVSSVIEVHFPPLSLERHPANPRDIAGSGIAPFFPVSSQPSGLYLPFHAFLFLCRVPLLIAVGFTYLLVFSWLPVNSLIKKTVLWSMLGIPGIWWVDLQIDGVKRGYEHEWNHVQNTMY